MSKGLGGWLADRLSVARLDAQTESFASIHDVDQIYEMMAPFALGTYETKETLRRKRIEIYSMWHKMQTDPSIAEGLALQVTAALGGHESRAEMVFITPNEKIRGDGHTNKALRQKVEAMQKRVNHLINKNCVKVCRDAVGFGDAYSRMYGQKGYGLVDMMCNEYTFPPLIQAYEQGGQTIGYQALEAKDWQRSTTKMTRLQMLRFKMPRVTNVPQRDMVEGLIRAKMLRADVRSEMPIVESQVGGSFLFEIEEPYRNVHLALAGMNSQQIADAVKQMFMTVDMSGMPLSQRKKYKDGLNSIINNHQEFVKSALTGGDSIWATQVHVLPTYGDKQILNPVGDIMGQRTTPINTEYLMVNIRRLMGGLGTDPSMVGWADMLAGGLGDGAAFHTSAQIMRRSQLIRQACTDWVNDICRLDWAYAHNEWIDGTDLPWQVEFYSDQSAAATEALTNKMTRMNTLAVTSQAIAGLKELGLDEDTYTMMLEDIGGMDLDQAEKIAKALKNAPPMGGDGFDQPGEPIEPPAGDPLTQQDDDEEGI